MLNIVFEDASLFVVNKPSGVLSQPGKTVDGSIATLAREVFPQATGPMLVHRLDMDTSGLLLLAKTKDIHRALQMQFEKRQVYKRYVALVESAPTGIGGLINLPLRADVDNRPSQCVCAVHGKPSLSLWRKQNNEAGCRRIVFFPVTGRTHQLRMHAAHPCGLGAAIVGDRLYGNSANRLCLHAEAISFINPANHRRIVVQSDAPF